MTAAVIRGSIPAGAGKPRTPQRSAASARVHPRRRGEADRAAGPRSVRRGPSPQARGSPRRSRPPPSAAGSIPAGAGKPRSPAMPSRASGVHPRRRGEATTSRRNSRGSGGPSPQARGSPVRARCPAADAGSIPAGAGKPPSPPAPTAVPWVHPRRRGEASDVDDMNRPARGPSPQARGSPYAGAQNEAAAGSIPAGAGKPRRTRAAPDELGVHPRRRGEADPITRRTLDFSGPSPQARGSPGGAQPCQRIPRSIPAGAGKPPARPLRRWCPGVHPRRRGEAGALPVRSVAS